MKASPRQHMAKKRRSKSCFVPRCNGGDEVGIQKFTAPKDESLRKKWGKMILRADREITQFDTVCAKHFDEAAIERYHHYIINGERVVLQRGRAILKPGAIPTKFDYLRLPKGYSVIDRISAPSQENELPNKIIQHKRKCCRKISSAAPNKMKLDNPQCDMDIDAEIDKDEDDCASKGLKTESVEGIDKKLEIEENIDTEHESEDVPIYRCSKSPNVKLRHSYSKGLRLPERDEKADTQHKMKVFAGDKIRSSKGETSSSAIEEDILVEGNQFSISDVSLPSSYWQKIQFPKSRDTAVFAVWDSYPLVESVVLPPPAKSVVVKQSSEDLVCTIFVAGIKIQECNIPCRLEALEVLLKEVNKNNLRECEGLGKSEAVIDFPSLTPDERLLVQQDNLRSKDCRGFVVSGKVCLPCFEAKQTAF